MKQYELVYRQPYEYDDDSPDGIGDHEICYSRSTHVFKVNDDAEAQNIVHKFLSEGALEFGVHYGSPSPGKYPRGFISLNEVYVKREVKI